MTRFKNILRILWAAAGLTFIWFDVNFFGNTGFSPSFWYILGILAFSGAITGITGGLGAALLAQGVLKYKQNVSVVLGKIIFSPNFTIFDRVAHAFFIIYGAFLIKMQIGRILRRHRERNEVQL